jgi:hypothetical protein
MASLVLSLDTVPADSTDVSASQLLNRNISASPGPAPLGSEITRAEQLAKPLTFLAERGAFCRRNARSRGENACKNLRKGAPPGLFFFRQMSDFNGLERIFLPTPGAARESGG